ncbi:MAG: carboxypeptidase regulatory-like domain-containing protein [Alphaproteobacteria bacterium]|nr:carboxypeptidase regulatory-like domain-containing protein [Alphaproteobacteria bacterium]MCB9696743.1 carboxypeptidase regulatory-like domain-containing protein [Alphaproteobacteria bacterium]
MSFVLALPLMVVDAEASPGGFGRLEGVVTSPEDGRGLPNVTVVVRPAKPEGLPKAAKEELAPGRLDTTDRDGLFQFDELPPGLYSLDVIGQSVRDSLSGPSGWVWTQVASVLVVPGVTTTEQVVLPQAAPQPPPKGAPGT